MCVEVTKKEQKMTFEFERFEKIGSIFKSRVSISRTGVISFTEGAKNAFKLSQENAKYVELYYDRHARVIGLNFRSDQNGAVVTTHFRETGLDFATKAFLDYYGILPRETSFYEVEKDQESGFIIIKLDTAKIRKTSKEPQKQEVMNNMFGSDGAL